MHLKSAMLDAERQMQAQHHELADITQEQARIRADMGAVSQTSQSYTRLLTRLNDRETRIEAPQGGLEQLKRTGDQQRKALETYLLNTTVG